MKRIRGDHTVFALAIAALVALGTWWSVFLSRAVEMERQASLDRLQNRAQVTAMLLGHSPGTAKTELLRGDVEIVPAEAVVPGDLSTPATPFHPELAVRPRARDLAEVEDRIVRRRAMVLGEGLMMFVLLGVVTLMLYRMVLQERRHLQRMERFVSAVTHEMKTPLAGMKSLLQTLAAGRVPAEQAPRLLAMGLAEADRLEHSIENVLLAGSIRTDRLDVHPVPVSLREELEGFVDHRRRTLVDHPDAISLQWALEVPDVRVRADTHALRVVLENLVDNGFKYGGPDPEVVVRAYRDDGDVAVSVIDRGEGFEPHRAEELFARFHRAAERRGAVQHGTGLGLSIARELARRMGGDLVAASEGPGQGSTFTLVLAPAPEEEA